MCESINKLGKQRATSEAATRAATKLIVEPYPTAEVVRMMTGGRYNETTRRMHAASRAVDVAQVELDRAIEMLKLRLQEYSEAVDQELERLMP